ncbi:MAG: hypothetical protein K940chlam2_00222 [Chlamydiae bacterium]|nr:hypothetical protein [Chlamydiota bacterium]
MIREEKVKRKEIKMVQPAQHTHRQVVTGAPGQPVQTQPPTGKMSKVIPKIAEKVAFVAIVLFNPHQAQVWVDLLRNFNGRG